MYHRVFILVYLLVKISWCQEIDSNICPNGLTQSPMDLQWPKFIPNRFKFHTEISSIIETFQITQLFISSYSDVIYFHDYNVDLQTYYNFQTNEKLFVDEEMNCDRSEIQSNEYVPFAANYIVKPSILLGFDGRNNYNNEFYTRYIGKDVIRDGISTKKFESCFFLAQENLTINATYYISESPPGGANMNAAPDFVQIDVHTNQYLYTLNIIRFESNPSLSITTPPGVYCPDRINTKEFPQNLPSRLSLLSEIYSPSHDGTKADFESFDHLVDEALEFERFDYNIDKTISPSSPNRLLIDHSANLTYMYTSETQQCIVTNTFTEPMQTINELLFQFGNTTDSSLIHYTGITDCGREHVQCHRWIGQRNFNQFVKQYEWYWSAKYNHIDLQEFILIKLNIDTIMKEDSSERDHQESNIFNYTPWPNSMQMIDSTLGECYRALGPSQDYNYAILRLTLNNDAKYPVHQHLLSLQNRLHIQIANDLNIRHIRLSSFVIDTTRDLIDQKYKDVYVTFTLLDNPPMLSNSHKELSSLELIRQLSRRINDGKFHVRDNDGAFDLQARPNSLRTLVLYLLPSQNHTNYFNQTIFVYHNITQTNIKQREKIVTKHTGSQITALWTGFALLGIVVALAIGSFISIKKWTPIVNSRRT